MSPPTPTQLAWRGRIEAVLRVVEPALDLVLAAGDRVSRALDRDGLSTPPPARRVDARVPPPAVGRGPADAATSE